MLLYLCSNIHSNYYYYNIHNIIIIIIYNNFYYYYYFKKSDDKGKPSGESFHTGVRDGFPGAKGKLSLFVCLFVLAALGLCCCAGAFSSCAERGLLFVAVCGL